MGIGIFEANERRENMGREDRAAERFRGTPAADLLARAAAGEVLWPSRLTPGEKRSANALRNALLLGERGRVTKLGLGVAALLAGGAR